MKRLVALILSVSLILSCAACSKKGNPSEENPNSTPTGTVTGPGTDPVSDPGSNPKATPGADPSGTLKATPVPTAAIQIPDNPELKNIELTGIKKMPADGIGEPGVDFTPLKSSPSDGWDAENPEPYFNPLGSADNYNYISDNNLSNPGYYSELTLDILDDDGVTPISFRVYGNFCKMYLNCDGVAPILYAAKAKGAKIYKSFTGTGVFYIKENEDFGWWGRIDTERGDEFALSLCRVRLLHENQAYSPDTTEDYFSEGEAYLYPEFTKTSLYSLKANITSPWKNEDAILDISAQANFCIGSNEYDMDNVPLCNSQFHGMNAKLGESYVFDSLVPLPYPMALHFVVRDAENEKLPITFSYEETASILPVTYGNEMGLIRIIGLSQGFGAKISPSNCCEIDAQGFNSYDVMRRPFRDDEGNYCFSVPAGYYDLEVGTDRMEYDSCFTNMVPVSANRVTEVIIPEEFRVTMESIGAENADFSEKAGNMEIVDIKEKDGKGTIEIMVHDPLERDVFPQPEDFKISENGAEGKTLKVDRMAAATNVVLCIDSSGSMKDDMKATLDAAKLFVESLNDKTSITIVQFEQNITVHKGTTKEDAITALGKIKANGGTSCYDAVDKALELLEGKSNPNVVVFSDGADSREPGVSGTGSSISKEDICEKIKASGVTVLTIGFGADHDPKALIEMSESSEKGDYFKAADQTQLGSAFAAVASKFGNNFVLEYERPVIVEDKKSDVPLVSIVMDISGSMDMDPTGDSDDVDFRMEKMRVIFHNFIQKLPSNTLLQYSTFHTYSGGSDLNQVKQISTNDKGKVLYSISQQMAEGGTPIIEALGNAHKALLPISSSKKVMVFFTDAAIAPNPDDVDEVHEFSEALEEINKSGIRCLFVGLGNKEYASLYEDGFKNAAELAGGDYIITSEFGEIEKKLEELLSKVDVPNDKETGVNVLVNLNALTEDGSIMNYSASCQNEEINPVKKEGKSKEPGVIEIRDGGIYEKYNKENSKLLYGSESGIDDTNIVISMNYENKVACNNFAEINVSKAYLMDSFRGVDINPELLALNIDFTYLRKDEKAQEVTYSIPSIFNHMFVCVDGTLYPASELTYLAEKPLVVPGNPELSVSEKKDGTQRLLRGETKSGIVIFAIDAPYTWQQLSLHLFDTSYGNISIPLIGALPEVMTNIDRLPKEVTCVNDAFTLTLNGVSDTYEMNDFTIIEKEDALLRVLDTTLESKVQALLDIKPQERFYYRIGTNCGDFFIDMHNIVKSMPFGFNGKTMFGPGTKATERIPFMIPSALKDAKASLWGDVVGGSYDIAVTSGSVWEDRISNRQTFENEYFTFTINELSKLDSESVILDFTITDKVDGEGLSGIDSLFYFKRDTSKLPKDVPLMETVTSKGLGDFADISSVFSPLGVVTADYGNTSSLILGAMTENGNWAVFDGQSRRGLLCYYLGYDYDPSEWTLVSDFLPDLSAKIAKQDFSNPALLTRREYYNSVTEDYEDVIQMKIEKAIAEYEALHPETAVTKLGLTDEEIIGNHVKAPTLTIYGTKLLASVQNLDDFYKVMNLVNPCFISGNVAHSPENVLTSGVGNDAEMILLAEKMLNQLGYTTQIRLLTLNETGLENLRRVCNYYDVPSTIHTIAFTDEKGKAYSYVPAFHRDFTELNGLFAKAENSSNIYANGENYIKVVVEAKPNEATSLAKGLSIMSDIGGILGGGSEENSDGYEDVVLLDAGFDGRVVGNDMMDISFVAMGKGKDGKSDIITAAADTENGLLTSPNYWIDLSAYDDIRSIRIEVSGDGLYFPAIHTLHLEQGEKLTDIFQTIAFNYPTLTEASAKAYEEAVADVTNHMADGMDTDYGKARWYTHEALARLIYNYSNQSNMLLDQLHLVKDESNRYGVMVSTVRVKDGKLTASVDLAQIEDSVYPEYRFEENYPDIDMGQSVKTYRTLLGMSMSLTEGMVFSGADGNSFLDVWATLPEDAGFLYLSRDDGENAAEVLKDYGYPQFLLDRMKERSVSFILPTKPGKLNGEDHFAWLEINADNGSLISVLDTGERSGMACYILGLTPKNALEFTVGAFIGVSCSVFGISAYSLKEIDNKEIMYDAAVLMGIQYNKLRGFIDGVNDKVSWATDPIGSLKGKIESAAKEKVQADQFDIEKIYEEITGDKNKEPDFAEGFLYACNLYFGVDVSRYADYD